MADPTDVNESSNHLVKMSPSTRESEPCEAAGRLVPPAFPVDATASTAPASSYRVISASWTPATLASPLLSTPRTASNVKRYVEPIGGDGDGGGGLGGAGGLGDADGGFIAPGASGDGGLGDGGGDGLADGGGVGGGLVPRKPPAPW